MREATEEFFQSASPEVLNYGVLQGDQRFRDSLARFLSKNDVFCLRLNENINAQELQHKALERQVGFLDGNLFSSCSGMKTHIRLSFAYYNEGDIREGIARLKPLFD